MKKIWTIVCFCSFIVATTSVSFADVSASSTDFGVFDIGFPFASTITIGDNEVISDVMLTINIEHSFIGDIKATLTHVETGSVIFLIPPSPQGLAHPANLGIDFFNLDVLIPGPYTFSDAGLMTITAASYLGGNSYEIPTGVYLASDGTTTGSGSMAAIFAGESTQGQWRIDFTDLAAQDDGYINGWSIEFTSSSNIPEPGSLGLLSLVALTGLLFRRR